MDVALRAFLYRRRSIIRRVVVVQSSLTGVRYRNFVSLRRRAFSFVKPCAPNGIYRIKRRVPDKAGNKSSTCLNCPDGGGGGVSRRVRKSARVPLFVSIDSVTFYVNAVNSYRNRTGRRVRRTVLLIQSSLFTRTFRLFE